MKYSIVNLHYNESEADYRRALQSIAYQTFKDYECICVDHASISGLPVEEIVNEFGFSYLRLHENRLCGFGHNEAIKAAKGEYICFIDSDDFVMPDYLSLIDTFNQGEDVIFLGVQSFGDWKFQFVPGAENTPKLSDFMFHANFFKCIKRSFLIENDLWELEGMVMSDYDLCKKIEKTLTSFSFVPEVIYMYQTGKPVTWVSDIDEVSRIHEEWSTAWEQKRK